MRGICINDQTLAGFLAPGGSADLIEYNTFHNDGNFDFIVPVTADIVVLEVFNAVVVDLQGKIRCAVDCLLFKRKRGGFVTL